MPKLKDQPLEITRPVVCRCVSGNANSSSTWTWYTSGQTTAINWHDAINRQLATVHQSRSPVKGRRTKMSKSNFFFWKTDARLVVSLTRRKKKRPSQSSEKQRNETHFCRRRLDLFFFGAAPGGPKGVEGRAGGGQGLKWSLTNFQQLLKRQRRIFLSPKTLNWNRWTGGSAPLRRRWLMNGNKGLPLQSDDSSLYQSICKFQSTFDGSRRGVVHSQVRIFFRIFSGVLGFF